MEILGVRLHIPENWSKPFVFYWLLSSPALIILAFQVSFWWWFGSAVAFFLIPEVRVVLAKNNKFPPLTHTIRWFLPNWAAFPLIYFALGAVGAHWLEFQRSWAIGLLLGLLGWLTDHFTVTYAEPDPFPFTRGAAAQAATERADLVHPIRPL